MIPNTYSTPKEARRLRMVYWDATYANEINTQGQHIPAFTTDQGVPADAHLLDIVIGRIPLEGMRILHKLAFVYEHPTFEPVEPGAYIPEQEIRLHRVESDERALEALAHLPLQMNYTEDFECPFHCTDETVNQRDAAFQHTDTCPIILAQKSIERRRASKN